MATHDTKITSWFQGLRDGVSGVAGSLESVVNGRFPVEVLELEDVLFHHNSAVVMPAVPTEDDADDDSDGSDDQTAMAGLPALALALRRCEQSDDIEMVVTGHTDTSGDDAINFALSDKRALSVVHLLAPDAPEPAGFRRQKWASNAFARHKVEDVQQVLAWAATNSRFGWACDPGAIDDAWGPNTRNAVVTFVSMFNGMFVPRHDDLEEVPSTVASRMQNDAKHRAPREFWAAVFELYTDEIAHLLALDRAGLAGLKASSVRFVDDTKPHLGCGESFPVDDADRDDYRSQENRRVEILFFPAGKAPVLDCPAQRETKHTEQECPLWRKQHFRRVYVAPEQLTMVPYRLRFTYFDGIKNDWQSVPDGLPISVRDDRHDSCAARVRHADGVYVVNVFDDAERTSIEFGFETTDRWIHTADADSTPEIVTKTAEEMAALTRAERAHYYDLPAVWSSWNFHTVIGEPEEDTTGIARFQDAMDDGGYKPFGSTEMGDADVMEFCLDDVVLLREDGPAQVVLDADGHDDPRPLSEKSRVKLVVAHPDHGRPVLHSTEESSDPMGPRARIAFPENLIVERAPRLKAVYFCNDFYAVRDRRTTVAEGWRTSSTNKPVLGARAAIRNVRADNVTSENHFRRPYGSTGDYELHWLEDMDSKGERPVHYVVQLVSSYFMHDARRAHQDAATDAQRAQYITDFEDVGIYAAMDHWNFKGYGAEPQNAGDTDPYVEHFIVFDERETIERDGIDFEVDAHEERDEIKPALSTAGFAAARRTARGGQPKFVSFLIPDQPTRTGGSWQFSIRNESGTDFSVMQIRASTFEPQQGAAIGAGFRAVLPAREFGHDFHYFVFAHELGHALGSPDEYLKASTWRRSDGGRGSLRLPTFAQFDVRYSMEYNRTSMMVWNGAPRLHNYWYAARKVQDDRFPGQELRVKAAHGDQAYDYGRKVADLHLEDESWKPVYEEEQGDVAGRRDPRRLRLELHYVGDDEASAHNFVADQDRRYQGVIVIRPMLSLPKVSPDGTAPAEWPERLDRNQWTLLNDLSSRLSALVGKYRATSTMDGFEDLFVYVRPGIMAKSEGSRSHGDRNYELQILDEDTPRRSDGIEVDGRDLKVHRDVSGESLTRYLLGAPARSSDHDADVRRALNRMVAAFWDRAKDADRVTGDCSVQSIGSS